MEWLDPCFKNRNASWGSAANDVCVVGTRIAHKKL
jgi:hypothetical protein